MSESWGLSAAATIPILVNPAAGRGHSEAWLRLKEFAADAKIPADFHVTHSRKEMESTAAEIVRNGAKLLFIMGGDGTAQTLVNVPGAREIAIGILPVGTGNDFASALGIPRDPVRAMQALLAGKVRSLDLARVRTADGKECLYCGGGGMGLDGEAAKLTSERYTWLRGRPRYIAAALHAFCTFGPIMVRVTFPDTDRTALERRVLLAAALNTPTYGAGLRLANDARLDDALLDLVFVNPLSVPAVAGVVLDWALSGRLRTARITTLTAVRFQIASDCPCLFQADGEIIGPAPVEIEVVPRAAKVLVPRDSIYA
jgi:diacylglycerol kinase (ATP)